MPKKVNVTKSGKQRQRDYMLKIRFNEAKYAEYKQKERERWHGRKEKQKCNLSQYSLLAVHFFITFKT